MNIETASCRNLAERVRLATRNAPPEIRRRILAHAGITDDAESNGTTAPTPSGKVNRPPSPTSRFGVRNNRPTCGTLVGAVAPGLSVLVATPESTVPVREVFTRAAWRSILADIREGHHVDLKYGHGQLDFALASTRDGSLRFEIHKSAGLMFEARLADTPHHGVFTNDIGPAGVAVSVAFRKPRGKLRDYRGQIVRVIHSAEIDHVAIVRDGRTGAYPGARAFRSAPGDREGFKATWTRALVHAWEISKVDGGSLVDLWSLED